MKNETVLVASHDHALYAIDQHLLGLDVADPLHRVVTAVMTVHIAQPSPTGRPDPDCWACEGTGTYDQHGEREHCHCRCPWCVGCSQPVCDGPCETVAAVGAELGIEGLD